jgi:hypothetical protein
MSCGTEHALIFPTICLNVGNIKAYYVECCQSHKILLWICFEFKIHSTHYIVLILSYHAHPNIAHLNTIWLPTKYCTP